MKAWPLKQFLSLNTERSFSWNCFEVIALVRQHMVHPYVYEKQLVELVYHNPGNQLDHILPPTNDANIFIVLLIDVQQQTIIGHYVQDLNFYKNELL